MSHFQQRDAQGRLKRQVQSVAGKVSLLMHDRNEYRAGVTSDVGDPAELRKFFEAGLLACDEAEEHGC